jgi:HEAT repeat protein
MTSPIVGQKPVISPDACFRVFLYSETIANAQDGIFMSIETLIETINTQKPLKAAQAIRELGKLSDERAVGVLIDVLHHGNVLTQQAAAEALAAFNTEIVTQALCKALKEVSPLIRIQIIKSLEHMKRFEAIPCLIEALQNAESESLQYTIIEALGNLNAVQARDMIEPFLDHPNHHVRKRASIAFAKISEAPQL